MSHAIHVKRAYEAPADGDGCRILVDGIWPRGVSKDELRADLWARDVAPSSGLRQWFGHDADKWDEFRERYFDELRANPEAVEEIRERLQRGPVTLLFGARDEEHNQAVALKAFLDREQS